MTTRHAFPLGSWARAVCALIALAGVLWLPAVAAAHPLGNFTVNRYSRIEVGSQAIRLRYVLDLAEIPTLQELRQAGIVGKPDDAALHGLLLSKTPELAAGAQLSVDGRWVPWVVEDAQVELVPGQANLDTLRIVLRLRAPPGREDGARLEYRDGNYSGRIGWHEVVLRGVDGVGLAGSTVPDRDLSDELRAYPSDPAQPPLDVSSARATISLVGGSGSESGSQPAEQAPILSRPRLALDPAADYLAGFLRGDGSVGGAGLAVAFLVAVGLGAMHALEPGHGKALVGGYLVGSRGTARQAILLGLTVTATHTIGVYALGAVTLVAAQYVVPERLYPVLGVASGLMVAAIGLSLVRSRLLGRPDQHGHDHGGYADGHGGHSHRHGHPSHSPSDHSHGHGDDLHGPGGYSHTYGDHSHHHEDHPHEHRAHSYSNGLLQTGGGGRPGGRSLLTLGISGGLLPCPSALVVLLAAVSFQNVPLGMGLVAAFSVGLAGVLTAVGLLVVYGGRVLSRSGFAHQVGRSAPAQALPALSAAGITLAGLAIAAQAAGALG